MPVWGWALLIGLTGLLMLVFLAGIVGGTQRLRTRRRAHTDTRDLGAPLPPETAYALDELTEHELEAEREHEAERRNGSRAALSRDR